ncbi:hypothetical protein F0562_025547 [Nyssa sinensis]|uniref:Uncharacterized protein n=1 Tax=Nyssa sinensis TaxID=561372 RepID=A0A5J5B6M1_9ASTE|nr:hypothetical protein F0562_025547 [Nyssa sinensis]
MPRDTPRGARCPPRWQGWHLREHIDSLGFGRPLNLHQSTPRADRWTDLSSFHIRPRCIAALIRFPPDNFKHSLTFFSKSFSSFPLSTCLLSVSRPYLALDEIYRPIGATFPNNPTCRQRLVVQQGPGMTGFLPSQVPPSTGLGPGPSLRTLLHTTIRMAWLHDFQARLYPVRSSLLRESWFSGLLATSSAVNPPRCRDLNTSPDHSIGRSDRRCVQRART